MSDLHAEYAAVCNATEKALGELFAVLEAQTPALPEYASWRALRKRRDELRELVRDQLDHSKPSKRKRGQ